MPPQTLSIVIPVFNESENVTDLAMEIVASTTTLPVTEIIFVDDGSTDDTLTVLQSLKPGIPHLRILHHTTRAGQSAAMMTGARAATGDLIVTMDGDGQNDPADIAALYNIYINHAAPAKAGAQCAVDPGFCRDGKTLGMVAGQRRKRNDDWVKRMSSRIANKVRNGLLNDGLRDGGCSLKLIRRDVYVRLPYFAHMHRFLAALVIREGFVVTTVDVNHRPRTRGVSKYNLWNRLWVGIVDLMGVLWLTARGKIPNEIKEV
jgi:dolichol-phosphate mannosyltransferase